MIGITLVKYLNNLAGRGSLRLGSMHIGPWLHFLRVLPRRFLNSSEIAARQAFRYLLCRTGTVLNLRKCPIGRLIHAPAGTGMPTRARHKPSHSLRHFNQRGRRAEAGRQAGGRAGGLGKKSEVCTRYLYSTCTVVQYQYCTNCTVL